MKRNTSTAIVTVIATAIAAILFAFPSMASTIDVILERVITLSEKDGNIIQKPEAFIITEGKNILVADGKAGHIKIFDMKGNLLKTFGTKGVGPNEFVWPRLMAYLAPYVAIVDNRRNFFFLYKRTSDNHFQFIDRYFSESTTSDDFQLIDENTLLIAGEKSAVEKNDMELYQLYQYNFKSKTPDLILKKETAFGLNSLQEFRNERSRSLQYIGLVFFVDFSADSIFFVWTCDTKITKIDRKTGARSYFEKKTANFVPPYVDNEIKNAFHNMDHLLIYKLRKNMSYVREIFVTNTKKVGLGCVGPFKKDGTLQIMLQLYTTDGQFLKEINILNSKASHHYEVYFYFKKSDNRFYILDTDTSLKDDTLFKIYEYRIVE